MIPPNCKIFIRELPVKYAAQDIREVVARLLPELEPTIECNQCSEQYRGKTTFVFDALFRLVNAQLKAEARGDIRSDGTKERPPKTDRRT